MLDNSNGWLRILALIIPYLIIVGFSQLIGALIAGVDITSMGYALSTKQHFIISFFNLLGVLLLLRLFMKNVDKEKFMKLGLSTKGRLKEFNMGFLIGAVVMLFAYLLLYFMDEIRFKKIDYNTDELTLLILVCSFVAISEEVLMRGYVLKNLMLSFNRYVALIVSSFLFAVIHLANPNIDWLGFLNLFLAGILLGISYVYTKNLWFPIALHWSWNLFQTLIGFNVSGQDFYSIIQFKIPKSNLLNGGDFGFEGSILSIIAQFILITFVWKYYANKKR